MQSNKILLFISILLLYTTSSWAQCSIDFVTVASDCNGSCTASAVLTINNGTPPYELTGLATNHTITNDYYSLSDLCAGDYELTLTDATGASVTQMLDIPLNNFIASVNSFTNASCTNTCNGSVVIAINGDYPPYTVWLNGFSYPDIYDNIVVLPDLCADNYEMQVMDSLGCLNTNSFFSIEAVSSLSITMPDAPTINSGDIIPLNTTINGGLLPYTYQWSNAESLSNANEANPLAYPTSTTAYQLTVTDAAGCSSTETLMVHVMSDCSESIVLNISTEVATCSTNCNGSANVMVVGGVAPYNLVWDNSYGVAESIDAISSTNFTLNDLCEGYYSLQLIDALGCQIYNSFNVYANNMILSPIVTAPCATDSSTCNANVSLNMIGAIPDDYSISINGEAVTFGMSGSMPVINNLCPGNYDIVLTDYSNGCSASTNVTIDFNTLDDFSFDLIQTETCIGNCDAAGIINLTSGLPPFSVYTETSITPFQSNSYTITIDGLCSGLQDITLIDGNGCTIDAEIAIEAPSTLVAQTCEDIGIALGESALLSVAVSGGMPPYEVFWTPSDALDDYQSMTPTATPFNTTTFMVTVIDSNGCLAGNSVTVNITNTTLIAFDDTLSLYINEVATTNVLGNDYNPNPDVTLTINTILSNPTNGEITYSINGTLTYIPNPGFYGNDVLQYLTCDDNGACSSAFLYITVVNCNLSVVSDNNTSIEIGDTLVLNASFSGGTAPFAVSWSPSLSLSDPNTLSTAAYPTTTTIYTVTVVDGNNCSSSSQVSINVGDTCNDCVWPGDVNNDGIANNFDVLSIGVAYGLTGAPRPDQSIDWYHHPASNWNNIFADATNYKHADCSGNGVINAIDTLAISANYGFTHSKNETITEGEAPLYIKQEKSSYLPGEYISLPIMLGEEDIPVEDVYALAFSIEYDNLYVEPNTFSVNFNDAWLADSANLLCFKKPLGNGKVDVALARINHANTSGYGRIATISFILIDNIDGKNETEEVALNINLTNIRCIRNNETHIDLSPYPETLNITKNILPEPNNFIYPNPALNELTLNLSNNEASEIVIVNLVGQQMYYTQNIGFTRHRIDVSDFEQGIYLMQVRINGITRTHKLFLGWED